MADYAIQAINNAITASGQCKAVCHATVVVGSSPPMEVDFDVIVNFGASVTITNNNILSAAVSAARTHFGLSVDQGGSDRQSLFGGRTA